MLRADGISVWYGSKTVVRNASVSVEKGKIKALIGLTGSGKSTLLYALSGLIPHVISARMEGKVLVDGKELSEPPNEVALCLQSPDAQMLGDTVREVVGKGERWLQKFGLENRAEDDPFSLSYGERQILAVISAAALGKKYLLLDEPTTALDWKRARELYEWLNEMKKRCGILVVEHNLQVVPQFADHFYFMKKGTIVKSSRKFEGVECLI